MWSDMGERRPRWDVHRDYGREQQIFTLVTVKDVKWEVGCGGKGAGMGRGRGVRDGQCRSG